MKAGENKKETLKIVRRVLPSVNLYGSDLIFKTFAKKFHSDLPLKDVGEIIRNDSTKFEKFCRGDFIHLNKLNEREVNHLNNLLEKADIIQLNELIDKANARVNTIMGFLMEKDD